MSLRKVAGLLAGFGLVTGLIGSGVGAQFTDQVLGIQHINVGTFGCQIVAATPGAAVIASDHKSVTYDAGTITSSVPSSSPFSFTVQNVGTIPQALTVSTSAVGAPFSIIGAPFAPVPLAANATTTYNTGLKWGELTNANLGQGGNVTWTVTCNENLPTVVFDNHPTTLPSNLPSYGPEAYSYNEWGGGVTLAGSARKLSAATVTMSSWACQTGGWSTGDCVTTPGATFDVPITFNVYNVGAGNTVGSLIATRTQTFTIPFRPSPDAVNCTGGRWFDGTDCFSGKAVNITFAFSGEALPGNVIFGVTFNTDNSGYSPLHGSNHPTDSLNIATYPGDGAATPAAVGTWLPNDVSTYLSNRSATTIVGTAPVTQMPTGPDDGFAGYMPAVQIMASF